MKPPLVSVCVPVFNAENTIERCLNGILSQDITETEMEILVVDNASEDLTVSIAERVLVNSPNARIIRNERNLGRVGNINRCLRLATGRYIKLALSNDVLFKNSIRVLLDEALQDDEIVMVCSRHRFYETIPLHIPEMKRDFKRMCFSSIDMIKFFAKNGCRTEGHNSMLLLREPVFKKNILFRKDLPYCSDYYHSIQLAACGRTVLLDAESYCFNGSVKSRNHYTNLSNISGFFLEQRECALLIKKLLQDYGSDSSIAFQYLFGQYMWFLGEGASIPFYDAFRVFAGVPHYMRQALFKGFYSQLKGKLSFVASICKKLGLYSTLVGLREWLKPH